MMNAKDLYDLSAEEINLILNGMGKPASGGVPRSWCSDSGKVGGSYEATGMNNVGWYVKVDYENGDGFEESFTFEPDNKPRSWRECWQMTRGILKERLKDLEG